MNIGRWSAFLLLPVLLLLERFSYYGMRGVLFREFLASGKLSADEASAHMRWITWLILATPLFGGLVAIALKPRWTLAIGALIAAGGYAVLAVAGAGSFAAFIPLAIGLGLFRPAAFAAAATTVRDPDESARSALFVAMYAATNLAGFAGPLISGSLPADAEVRPFAISTITGAVLLGIAAILAIAVAVAPRLGDVREPADPPLTGRGEMGAVAVMALLIPATFAMSLADTLQFEPFSASASGMSRTWLFHLNPIAVLAITVLAGGAFAAAAYAGKRIPALYPAAAGMVLVTLGCAPLLALAGGNDAAMAGALASIVLVAFGEALVNPLALSRMAGGTHPRATTLVMAVWLSLAAGSSQIVYHVTRVASDRLGTTNAVAGLMLAVAAGGTLLAGVGVILLQRFAAAKLWPAERAFEDDAPTLAPN